MFGCNWQRADQAFQLAIFHRKLRMTCPISHTAPSQCSRDSTPWTGQSPACAIRKYLSLSMMQDHQDTALAHGEKTPF